MKLTNIPNDIVEILEVTKPYMTYMLDYDVSSYLALIYYLKRNQFDNYTVEQKFKKVFIDIEVFCDFSDEFPEPKYAKYPISSLSVVNDKQETTIYAVLLKHDLSKINITQLTDNIVKRTKDNYSNIIEDEFSLEIKIYENEAEMLKDFWLDLRNYDPAVIFGFNSNRFDFPYILNRTLKLLGDKAKNIISRFGIAEVNGNYVKVPEYLFVDIRELYVPPPEGHGFGKSLDKYNLDTIASAELGVTKVEYEGTLDELYIKDIETYLFYNMIDTYILYKLDKILKHFDLLNMQRRISYCPINRAISGRSVMGEQIQTYNEIASNKRVPRSFLVNEKYAIDGKRDNFTDSFSLKYYGAFVKQTPTSYYKGLIIDLDQTSMYPSLIKQYNIEFSTFKAKLYQPFVTDFVLNELHKLVNNTDYIKKLLMKIEITMKKHIDENDMNRKKEVLSKNIKYITIFLETIKNYGNLQKLLQNENYYLLKTKLIPLLEIIELIFSKNEYNELVYDYLFMNSNDFYDKYKNRKFLIYENPTDSNSKLLIVNLDELLSKYFNKYIITITGCMFIKHEEYTGKIIELINKLMKERKSLQNKLAELDPNDKLYDVYNNAQIAIKVFLNSLYGIYGFTSYRYNEKNIANTITISGRLLIKTASYIANKIVEEYRRELLTNIGK